MNRAVFIDRDGVINPLVYYADTGEHDSPRTPEDFEIYPYVPEALNTLKKAGYLLFLVSNQPGYAKGKIAWENVTAIERKLEEMSEKNGNLFERFFYCYHHPEAVIPEYKIRCECRKPGTLFPRTAAAGFSLCPAGCFFVGDSDKDILCGQAMGFKTIKIETGGPAGKSGETAPDYYAKNLFEAAGYIVSTENEVKP